MALDQNAGQKKKAVGLARNLFASVEPQPEPSMTVAAALAPVTVAAPAIETPKPAPAGAESKAEGKVIATQSGRSRKISFLTTRELEERFRKARLRAGFEKLEDAYNEAMKRFCDQVDRGEIDNF